MTQNTFLIVFVNFLFYNIRPDWNRAPPR